MKSHIYIYNLKLTYIIMHIILYRYDVQSNDHHSNNVLVSFGWVGYFQHFQIFIIVFCNTYVITVISYYHSNSSFYVIEFSFQF